METRRRIVAFNRVTADGYFSGPDGTLDFVVPDDELDRSAAEAVGRSGGNGTLLFGRRTYQMFESFWPRALDASSASPDPHSPGRGSPHMRAMAVFINEATKLVFSKTLKEVTWKNSRLLRELDPREIERLKGQEGADMMIFGSGSVVSQLTQHGLVDEYQFVVSPVLLGSGRTLLSGLSKRTKLALLETTPYPTGNLKLRYGRGE